MNVYAPTPTSKPAGSRDCGCGCGGRCGCESRCCDLECLVRPNFFCGQLLTDADLDASVDWTRRRLSLARYRDGWGVVCGLDVRCSPPRGGACCEPAKGPVVWLHPGYALDCCGNDLVVCEPLPVDLGGVCQPEDDPCAAPPSKTDPRAGTTPAGTEGTRATDNGASVSCWDRLKDGVFAVDLLLRYHEDLSHGQRALFNGRCDDRGACEYARVVERPCVSVRRVTDDNRQPAPSPDEAFRAKNEETRKAIRDAIRGGAQGLREYLRQHPIARFCFIEELRCCHAEIAAKPNGSPARKKEAQEELNDLELRIGIWLYVDWLLGQLACECWSCRPDEGVPLARVYLRRGEGARAECRVLMVDQAEPHRRPLSKDACGVVPPGYIDLRPYYGREYGEARAALLDRAIVQDEKAVPVGTTSLAKLRTPIMWSVPGQKVAALTLVDPRDRERIVGFIQV